jgi:BirA family transcriptional regulator, biotin operon repressor / biotin---[acetyl-CoA-carboxylase] ligase
MSHSDHTIPLQAGMISTHLQTAFIGKTIIVHETVTSTNEYAKGLNDSDGPHGTVVVAEEQTAGRGRFGRRWESSKSMNLLFSVLLRPDAFHNDRIPLVPFAAAVAVAEAIEAVTGLQVECKWPNDLLISRKKMTGMLLESSMVGARIEKLVLGIGINVNQTEFPESIIPQPTSLQIESGRVVDRNYLLERLLGTLEARYLQLLNEPPALMLATWKSRTTMFGTRVTVDEANKTFSGIAEDISADGSLLVRMDNRALTAVHAGDVTLGYQQSFLQH